MKRLVKMRKIGRGFPGIWILGLFMLSPCVRLSGDDLKAGTGQLVWPPPPDEARIAYVRSISQPSDAGVKPALFRRISNWILGSRQGNDGLIRPFGLALDDAEDLCMTDTGANAVCCYDPTAKRWYRWVEAGGVRFVSPVAVAKKGKTLYVADSGASAIIAFDLDGKLLFRVTQGLSRPSGVAVSGEHLLVADVDAHCIDIFDLHGKFLSRFGTRGTDPGQFNFPTHVAADPHGDIYVTDSMNSRVEVFDGQGNFRQQIGGLGDGPGNFNRPKGVAVDGSGRVYVVDSMFCNVQIFDPAGRLLLDFGSPGSGAGEFCLPNAISIGRNNMIYIADSYNGRVQVFKYIGSP